MDKQNSTVPALDKMDLIFDLLASSAYGLSQAQICQQLGLPKATVSRMINRLGELGYLEQNQDRGLYSLGAKLLTLGNLVNKRLDIAVIASSHLEDLSREINEMVKLSIMRSGTIYPLRSFESSKAMRITMDSGTVYPPYIGAAAKLLLALTDEGHSYCEKILPQVELEAWSPFSIKDKRILMDLLKEIREKNVAFDMQEESEGIYAIAMPVLNSSGQVIAAVSIPFFGDFESKKEKYYPMLKKCTENISLSMGYKQGEDA